MGPSLSVVVIGAGGHSQRHGTALSLLHDADPERVRLAAVCDLDTEKAAAYATTYGFERVYGNIEEMLEREHPDGVFAITPIGKTREIAGALLETRVPIVLEKPPGKDSDETRELLSIAERKGTPHMISFNRRFVPGVARAREWLAERGEQPPELVVARMLRDRRREHDFAIGTGIHAVDTALSFLPPPVAVDSHKIPSSHPGCNLYQARVLCRGGAAADLIIAPVVGVREERYEIYGADYCVHLDGTSGAVRIFDHGEIALEWFPPEDALPDEVNGTVGETDAFLTAVERGEGFWPGLREGLASMLVAEAVHGGGWSAIDRV